MKAKKPVRNSCLVTEYLFGICKSVILKEKFPNNHFVYWPHVQRS